MQVSAFGSEAKSMIPAIVPLKSQESESFGGVSHFNQN